MTISSPILQPVVVLLAWSMVIWFWMLITRVPAMQAMQIRLDPRIPPKNLTDPLPPSVRWKADNYNHLMEQPTVFYAAAIVMAITNPDDSLAANMAWCYVILRILHSLVQITFNHILTRIALFVVSSCTLIVLIERAVSSVM